MQFSSTDPIDTYKQVEIATRALSFDKITTEVFVGGNSVSVMDSSCIDPKQFKLLFQERLETLGLPRQICIYESIKTPGAFLIPQFLSKEDQYAIANLCTDSLIKPPYPTNLSVLDPTDVVHNWPNCSASNKIRWSSLGVYYNWTTRKYEFNTITPVPHIISYLARMAASLCKKLPDTELGSEWTCDCALLNIYRASDRLRGHKDDAEGGIKEPLVSLSIGAPAIFLVGGDHREELPLPILLRSGDCFVMADSARGIIHGISRVYTQNYCEDLMMSEGKGTLTELCGIPILTDRERLETLKDYLSRTRINLSIRRIEITYPVEPVQFVDEDDNQSKRAKLMNQ